MLIRDAEIDGAVRRDVRIRAGHIEAIAARLPRKPGETQLDAAGGALLPGLHDHHIHLFALAAARASVRCGPPAIRSAQQLEHALRAAAGDPADGDWIRGVGYHDSVAGPLDRRVLDAWVRDRPVRIQHRSGVLWMLNSAALARLGSSESLPDGAERDADGRPTGRLFRLDTWLRERLGSDAPPRLHEVGRELARCGVTGATDATADNGADALAAFARARAEGALPQRLVAMGGDALPQPAADAGLSRGARKIVLSEDALPSLEALSAWIGAAHADARAVAIHCVTRAELVLALAALDVAGASPGDRIEHAAIAPPELLPGLAASGACVVTQPNFVRERGDAYRVEVDARDRPWLYRARGLIEAGIRVGGGTDAPFGEPDPWLAMQAAVDRRSASGACLGADEALTPERALALFTSAAGDPGGPARRIAVGAAGDLCLLEHPWRRVRDSLSSEFVAATLCAGELVFRA